MIIKKQELMERICWLEMVTNFQEERITELEKDVKRLLKVVDVPKKTVKKVKAQK